MFKILMYVLLSPLFLIAAIVDLFRGHWRLSAVTRHEFSDGSVIDWPVGGHAGQAVIVREGPRMIEALRMAGAAEDQRGSIARVYPATGTLNDLPRISLPPSFGPDAEPIYTADEANEIIGAENWKRGIDRGIWLIDISVEPDHEKARRSRIRRAGVIAKDFATVNRLPVYQDRSEVYAPLSVWREVARRMQREGL